MILTAVGALAVWLGGAWFQTLAVLAVSLIVWEVARMLRPGADVAAIVLAVLTASALSAVISAGWGWPAFLLFAAPLAGAFALRDRAVLMAGGFALYAQLGGWALVLFRTEHGMAFVLWLLFVVAFTDMAGYFAGKMFGGPKFWPRVSPKKTWSGTAAGWLAAAVVGFAFMAPLGQGWLLVGVSVLVSFASQIGDILESALKRHVGIKDSSRLIPGHGGVFDRFDAIMGASVFVLALRAMGWAV